MKKGETLVSTPSDFRNVRVYRRQGSLGPVYALEFKNREHRTVADGWRGLLFGLWMVPLLIVALLGCGWLALIVLGYVFKPDQPFPPPAFWWAAGSPFLLAFVWWSGLPVRKLRIELDFGQQEIRVLQGRRVRLRRHLMIGNVTVEEHPEAEKERVDRQLNNKKRPGRKERQHCLVAWFGVAGTEPVDLVCRYEWPNRRSLLEVRAALLWVLKHSQENWTEGPDAPPLAPPLD